MILVTGASGLLGSHLVKTLIQQGKKVKAIDKNSFFSETLKRMEIEAAIWVEGDILDVKWLEEVMQDVDQVYHCAAMVSFNLRKKSLVYKVNVEGTANVVNACIGAGIKKMAHVSSVSALAAKDNKLITERMNTIAEIDNNTYDKSKYLGEMEVWRGIGEGLNAVIVNPSLVLGAGDWNTGTTEIFQTAYKEYPWYTTGVGGFVDVQDIVKAMIMLMESDIHAERFIISAGNMEYKEIFIRIAECFGKKPPHKKITPCLAAMVWRWEAIKGKFTNKEPLLTKETARIARSKRYYDNSKLKKYFPQFEYTPILQTISRICVTLKQRYNL